MVHKLRSSEAVFGACCRLARLCRDTPRHGEVLLLRVSSPAAGFSCSPYALESSARRYAASGHHVRGTGSIGGGARRKPRCCEGAFQLGRKSWISCCPSWTVSTCSQRASIPERDHLFLSGAVDRDSFGQRRSARRTSCRDRRSIRKLPYRES